MPFVTLIAAAIGRKLNNTCDIYDININIKQNNAL